MMAIDWDASPHVGLTPDARERVLIAATRLFARQGPPSVTLRWVAKASETPVEALSAEWPTVELLLTDVLKRLAGQLGGLVDGLQARVELLGEGQTVDLYQQIVARSLLDGLNPALLLDEFPNRDEWLAILRQRHGIDDRTARHRLCQIVALAWGWRLFGPHLKVASGLADEPDENFTAYLHAVVAQIATMPLD
jgi:AcrR family transcriptional regulator